MPKLIFVDTHVLIWGVQRNTASGKDDLIKRAALLLEQLKQPGVTVGISAITMGEFLIGYPAGDFEAAWVELNRKFRVYPYDAAAAVRAARIYHKWRDQKAEHDRIDVTDMRRCEISADMKILATAQANNAEAFYTGDDKLQKIAKLVPDIYTCDLPALDLTLDLDEEETEEEETNPEDDPEE
jgi:predicted nucleic acid-binding protein